MDKKIISRMKCLQYMMAITLIITLIICFKHIKNDVNRLSNISKEVERWEEIYPSYNEKGFFSDWF